MLWYRLNLFINFIIEKNMKKTSKPIFIILISCLSLCFTTNACAGGIGVEEQEAICKKIDDATRDLYGIGGTVYVNSEIPIFRFNFSRSAMDRGAWSIDKDIWRLREYRRFMHARSINAETIRAAQRIFFSESQLLTDRQQQLAQELQQLLGARVYKEEWRRQCQEQEESNLIEREQRLRRQVQEETNEEEGGVRQQLLRLELERIQLRIQGVRVKRQLQQGTYDVARQELRIQLDQIEAAQSLGREVRLMLRIQEETDEGVLQEWRQQLQARQGREEEQLLGGARQLRRLMRKEIMELRERGVQPMIFVGLGGEIGQLMPPTMEMYRLLQQRLELAQLLLREVQLRRGPQEETGEEGGRQLQLAQQQLRRLVQLLRPQEQEVENEVVPQQQQEEEEVEEVVNTTATAAEENESSNLGDFDQQLLFYENPKE